MLEFAFLLIAYLLFRVWKLERGIKELRRWIVEEYQPERGTYSSDKSTY